MEYVDITFLVENYFKFKYETLMRFLEYMYFNSQVEKWQRVNVCHQKYSKLSNSSKFITCDLCHTTSA